MKKNGFTLIEVLIAMGIVAVGLIAIVTLFPVGLRSSRLAGDFTTASFIAQQALDNIRANAQANDPADLVDEDNDGELFDDPNGNGLGYYELPISAVKGFLSPVRFPTEPTQARFWTISMNNVSSFNVYNSVGANLGAGTVGLIFTANDNSIQFILIENRDGSFYGAYGESGAGDVDYPEFVAGDEIVIHLEIHAGAPYYWYALRAPLTEDTNLNGILEGRLPDGTARTAPFNRINEDTGLDLIPDFYDTNNSGSYTAGLDQRGEITYAVDFPNDPHGDNRYAYDTGTGWWDDTVEVNADGAEGNGRIDAYPDDDIQRVTVIVGWREGSQDRAETFSASIANQFR